MENVYIYALIDPRDSQVRYVGKANNPLDRYTNHFNSARDKNTHKRNWINNVRESGYRPELLILDEVPKSDWQYWEKFYISLFKTWGFSLVNYTNGGDGTTFGNSGSFKKGQIPHNKGKKWSKEVIDKIRDNYKPNKGSYKKVIQYDLNKNEIKRYDCISDAVRESNGLFIIGKISECCNLKRNKHAGFIWRWDNGIDFIERDLSNKKRIPVIQYDLSKNEIGRYISATEAEKNTGVSYITILKCCRGESKRAGKFTWEFETNSDMII